LRPNVPLSTLNVGLWNSLRACEGFSSNEVVHELERAEHELHKNVFGVFAGVASAGRREKGFALGLEYERRINESFGIGAVA